MQQPPVADTKSSFRTRNFLDSFRYAWVGLFEVARTQRNFRTQLLITVGVVTLAFWLGLSPLEWAVLLVVINLMLVSEALNTAIEFTVDLVTQGEYNATARIIKDISAGACLITAGCSVLVGLLLFLPHVLEKIIFRLP